MSAAAPVCAQCSKPLEITIDDVDSDDGEAAGGIERSSSNSNSSTGGAMDTVPGQRVVPDDVLLSCGDHFHWECLLDAYELSRCPKCSHDITSFPTAGSSSTSTATVVPQAGLALGAAAIHPLPAPRILVDLHNEGGQQHGLDIYPLLREESYLRAYPDERKARAFLEFCREGDHRAVVEVLQSCNADESDEGENGDARMGDGSGGEDVETARADASLAINNSVDEILRYQDPIGDMQSGLHAAAANGHREVAWLLLLLASQLDELEFPALVFQEAAALGIMREEQSGKVDIRSLKDAHGRTAEDVAREVGTIWNGWIGNGRLAMP